MDADDEARAWAPRPAAGAPPGAPVPDLGLPGYSDFRLVAQGGEGAVYRARQDDLDRDVAVKVLRAADQGTLARFRRELEITVRLGRQHPHIVTVLATGTTTTGQPCLVMEFHDLGSVHDRLREHGPLPVAEVVAAGTAVADALAFAHTQGYLHRDVKPQNVLVLPTSYVLTDFGIARGADAGHTASLQLMSYRHAAPQMLDGATPAAADDQWSLGSTLFTLLEGEAPFATGKPDEDAVLPYIARVKAGGRRPWTRADVPAELKAVVERCLSPERDDRFPTTGALRDALMAIRTETRGWDVSAVDPEATRLAPGTRLPSLDPAPVGDFGPRPAPAADDDADATAVTPSGAPVEEDRGTMTGNLAELTVRHAPPAAPDFGPDAAFAPQPPVAPVLPAPPWQGRAEPVITPAPEWPEDTDERTQAIGGEQRRRSRAGIFTAAAVIAVMAGLVVGFLATRGAPAPPPAASSTAAPPTSTTATQPTNRPTNQPTTEQPTAPSQQVGGDPRFAPDLRRVADSGSTVDLTWVDPTGGQAQFVVVDLTTEGAPRAVATVAAGATTYTVTGLDPAQPRYCYQVIAIGLANPETERGASARVCVERN
ncbi:serine/threonine-protein kinase [Actinokineospora bangkokensis]|uniref:non-specific serine/threonine protein kinase n=1 Tax=Actinokineospora bangkokensis TaxID=1193682 RepID=A0A1Q9LTU6_9PSEU|nr:serine/threonine-protein kinase [Actinokineospora bangkokensis]OLR95456.1 hypothetical protein BJP25_06855 [Actinokineospora bangkokensis]